VTSRASSSLTAATQTRILIVDPRTFSVIFALPTVSIVVVALVARVTTLRSCNTCVSYDSLGEFDRAIADYTHALELDMAANAKTGGAQRQRGSGGLVE
jgi:hypothetical protein